MPEMRVHLYFVGLTLVGTILFLAPLGELWELVFQNVSILMKSRNIFLRYGLKDFLIILCALMENARN